MANYIKNSSKGLFKSAITGAYFGIINVLLVFIPLIYSLYGRAFLFNLYAFIAGVFLALLVIIIIKYTSIFHYDFLRLKYLYFSGTLFLVFFLGIMAKYIIDFGISFSNIYIVILQTILIIMSSFDIFLSAHKGMKKMKSLYLRTISIQYFKNAVIIMLGFLAGVLCLAPYFLIA